MARVWMTAVDKKMMDRLSDVLKRVLNSSHLFLRMFEERLRKYLLSVLATNLLRSLTCTKPAYRYNSLIILLREILNLAEILTVKNVLQLGLYVI